MNKSSPKQNLVGIDIGGTKTAVILGNSLPEILIRKSFPTMDPVNTLKKIEEIIKKISQEYNFSAIGISCGGPLNIKTGAILSPPNLPGWDEIYIVDYFEKIFSCPVYLENDANACAMAEWQWGAGRDCRNLVFLTFGTGLGAGLIFNNQLYRGSEDMAGELGHWRLAEDGPLGYNKAGSFEGFCSGGGISLLHKEKSTHVLSTKEICEQATQGSQVALNTINRSAQYLGKGLALLIDLLNPDKIIIGSVFARSETLFRAEMEKELQKEVLSSLYAPERIVSAELDEQIGDFATLVVAMKMGD